jgi:hypothetical protein
MRLSETEQSEQNMDERTSLSSRVGHGAPADLYARLLVASFPTGKTGGGRGERGGGNRASSPDFRPFFRLALAVDAGAAAPPYACKPVCSRSRQTSGSTRA